VGDAVFLGFIISFILLVCIINAIGD
jgi:hypothetical protein